MDFITGYAARYLRNANEVYPLLVVAHREHDTVDCALYKLVRDAFQGAGGSGTPQYFSIPVHAIAATIIMVLSDHDAKCRSFMTQREAEAVHHLILWYDLQRRYLQVRDGELYLRGTGRNQTGMMIPVKNRTCWLELIMAGYLHTPFRLLVANPGVVLARNVRREQERLRNIWYQRRDEERRMYGYRD